MATDSAQLPASFPWRITTEELIALAEQISALAKAGLPMEPALLNASRDLPRKAGQTAEALAQRLAAGMSWQDVLREAPQVFDPALRSIIQVGLRTGRLSVVLDCWTGTLRRLCELRQVARLALLYPLLVLGITYVLFILSIVWYIPQFVELATEFGALSVQSSWLLQHLADTTPWWAPWPPVVVTLGWIASSRWLPAEQNRPTTVVFPSLGRLNRIAQEAVFCDALEQLLTAGTPLDEALPLAGQVSSNRLFDQDARQLAEAVRLGVKVSPAPVRRGLPPLLRLAILQQAQRSALQGLLRRRTAWLIQQVHWQAAYQATRLPLLAALWFGAVWVAAFALWAFLPWYWLLFKAAEAALWAG